MASLSDVALALQTLVGDVLIAAGVNIVPEQVGVGQPFGPSLSEILGQGDAQVTIMPQPAASQNRTSRKLASGWKTTSVQPVDLVATVTDNGPAGKTIAFTGSVNAALNVHTFVGSPLRDVYYQTFTTDTPASVAAAVASAINTAAIPMISAAASGSNVIVTGSPFVKCNVGGTSTIKREIRRMMTPFQVSVWAADPVNRDKIGKLIENQVGVETTPFIAGADASAIRIRMRNAWWIDKSQSAYSLYEFHAVYEMEYPTLQTADAATVESVGLNVGNAPTVYTGG